MMPYACRRTFPRVDIAGIFYQNILGRGMVRVLTIAIIACCGVANAGDVLFISTATGGLRTFDAFAGLEQIAADRGFPRLHSMTGLPNGNMAAILIGDTEIRVINAGLERVGVLRSRSPILGLVPIGANLVGIVRSDEFTVMDERLTVQQKTTALADELRHRDFAILATNQFGAAAIVRDEGALPSKPRLLLCDVTLQKITSTTLEAPARFVLPMGENVCAVVRGEQIQVLGSNFSVQFTHRFDSRIAAVAPMAGGRIAIATAAGAISVWNWTSASAPPVVAETGGFGRVRAMTVLSNGDLAIASAEGKLCVEQLVEIPNSRDRSRLAEVAHVDGLGDITGLGVSCLSD